MRVELHNHFRDTHVTEASEVIIWDPFGNPIAVVLERAPGSYVVGHRGDKDWHQTLESLGLRDTAIVDVMHANSLNTD